MNVIAREKNNYHFRFTFQIFMRKAEEIMGEVIIKCFQTPKKKYFYDRYLNSVVEVNDQEFEALKEVEKTGRLPQTGILRRFIDSGLLQKTIVKKIEHPDTLNMKYFSECRIENLILQVTQQCNLRCKYCTYSGNYKNRMHTSKKMSYEHAKQAIDFYLERSREAESLCLSFYGGEPLLEYELIKQCVSYIKLKKRDLPIRFVMTTNATLLTKEKFDILIKNKFAIMISLDGDKQTHDSNRIFANGMGSFSLIMNNLRNLKSYDKQYFDEYISFNCVISVTTDTQATYEFFANTEMFHTEVVSLNYVATAGIKDKSLTEINQKNSNATDFEYLKMLLALIGKRGWDTKSKFLRRNADNIEMLYAHLHRHEPEKEIMHHNGPCMPGIRRIFVNTEGLIYPCERVSEADEEMCIGSLEKGFEYEKMDFLLNHGKLIEKNCRKCWNLRECLFCLGSVEKTTNKISAKDILKKCEISRANTEMLLQKVCILAEMGYKGYDNLKIIK